MKYFCLLTFVWALLPPTTTAASLAPNFVGRHMSEIRADPALEGWQLKLRKLDSHERRNTVLFQIPDAGTKLSKSSWIYLEVSDGLSVPDLVGRTAASARGQLNALRIGAATTERPYRRVETGLVGAQIPSPHTRIDPYNEIVFLVVSSRAITLVPAIPQTAKEEWPTFFKSQGLDLKVFHQTVEVPEVQVVLKPQCGHGWQPQPKLPAKKRKLEPPAGTWVDVGTKVTLSITRYAPTIIDLRYLPCSKFPVPEHIR